MMTQLTNAKHAETVADSGVRICAKNAIGVQPAVIHTADTMHRWLNVQLMHATNARARRNCADRMQHLSGPLHTHMKTVQ